MRAPIAEIVADLDHQVSSGRWLGGAEVVARIVAPSDYDAQAFVQHMDQLFLASTQGGPIAVNEDAAKSLRPREALYRLRFVATPGPGPLRPVRGAIRIDARSQSLIGQILGSFARTIRAEASITSG